MKLFVSPHAGGFHKDDFPAEFGPDQTGGHPHLIAGLRHFVGKFSGPEEFLHQLFVHGKGAGPLALDADAGQFAADHGNFPFQVAETRLPGVAADDLGNGGIGKLDPQVGQGVFPELPGDEKVLGDLDFFPLGVAGKIDDLQAVQEGRGQSLHHVGGGDEHDPGQVKGHIHVMVDEVGGFARDPGFPAAPRPGRPENPGRSCRFHPA